MRKKVTNEQVAQFIKQCADDVNEQMNYELKVAKSRMDRAEYQLIQTFSKEQRELYQEYLTERQNYIDVVVEKQKTK